jgi:hypothetical protein
MRSRVMREGTVTDIPYRGLHFARSGSAIREKTPTIWRKRLFVLSLISLYQYNSA